MKQIITSLVTLAILSSASILPAHTQTSAPADEADKQLEKTIQNIYKPIIRRTLPDSAIPMACNAVESLLSRSPMNNNRLVARYKNYMLEVSFAVATLSSKCDRGNNYDENIKRYAKIHTDAMQRYLIENRNDENEAKALCTKNYNTIVVVATDVVREFTKKN